MAKVASENLLETVVNWSQMKVAAAVASVVFGPKSWASWAAEQSRAAMVDGERERQRQRGVESTYLV